jgi:hypothetical protein
MKIMTANTILQFKIYIKLLQILNTKRGHDSADGIATYCGLVSLGFEYQ